MKVKHFKDKYEKKVKKIDKFPRRFTNVNWVIKITLIAFLISLMFSVITEVFVVRLNIIFGILITFLIIFIGVIFDMIGVSVTAADLKPFNSMASKKVSGSKTAIYLIHNAEKVSSFCNDVVGDVCGIISGSVGILISNLIANFLFLNKTLVTLIVTSLIAALTIAGKAIGKSYAINKSDVIVFRCAKIISFFKKERR